MFKMRFEKFDIVVSSQQNKLVFFYICFFFNGLKHRNRPFPFCCFLGSLQCNIVRLQFLFKSNQTMQRRKNENFIRLHNLSCIAQ